MWLESGDYGAGNKSGRSGQSETRLADASKGPDYASLK